jgi:hypothetical protein
VAGGRGIPGRDTSTDPSLGGPLLVGQVGSIAVATDALTAQSERLTRLQSSLVADAILLDRIDRLSSMTRGA